MKKKIRVLQVIDYIMDISGVSAVLMNYYRNMNSSDVVCDFLVHGPVDESVVKEIESKGSRLFVMSGLRGKEIMKYHKNLVVFFEEHEGEYDIIHAHVQNAAGFFMPIAKKYGIPIRILHSHNSRPADGFVKQIRNKLLVNKALRYSNIYMSCSDLASEYLFGTTKNVIKINNAVDLDEFRYNNVMRNKLREEYRVFDKRVVGHIGRMTEQKNHMFIIDIVKELKNLENGSQKSVFLLIGNGPLEETIKNQIREYELNDYFIFTGSVPNPEDYYQMMDAFILPSFYEGLPVVAVEAQAAGLRTLISDKITDEVLLSNCIEKLPIDKQDSSLMWAKRLSEIEVGERNEVEDALRRNGFDISLEADKLAEIYISLAETMKN